MLALARAESSPPPLSLPPKTKTKNRGSVDKKTVLENLDLALLAIDEVVDRGLILETDPATVAQRRRRCTRRRRRRRLWRRQFQCLAAEACGGASRTSAP